MKLQLTPWAIFLGILLFCKELIYTVGLRIFFIGYVFIVSFLIFPLFAGLPANILIIPIPVSYFLYAQPAFILAVAVSAFMIIFNRNVLSGKNLHIVFSILSAPCAVLVGIYVCEPSYTSTWTIGWIETYFDLAKGDFPDGLRLLFQGFILFMVVMLIMGTLLGGGLVASAVNEKVFKVLLAPPKSVKKQLIDYLQM